MVAVRVVVVDARRDLALVRLRSAASCSASDVRYLMAGTMCSTSWFRSADVSRFASATSATLRHVGLSTAMPEASVERQVAMRASSPP